MSVRGVLRWDASIEQLRSDQVVVDWSGRATLYGGPEDLYEKLGDTGTGGPAPKRDLTGFWAGRVAQRLNPIPPLTPWGEENRLPNWPSNWGSHRSYFRQDPGAG